MSRFPRCAIVTFLALCLLGAGPAEAKKNTFGCKGRTVAVRTVVSTYKAAEHKLSVFFFPYKLSRAEVKRVRNGGAFGVIMHKKGPKGGWSHPLYAQLDLRFSGGTKKIKSSALKSVTWSFNQFTGKHQLHSRTFSGNEIDKSWFKVLKGRLRKKSGFNLTSSGKKKVREHVYSWNLKLRSVMWPLEN